MADIILQFKRERKKQSSVTGYVDVKATSNDIVGSGKSPNITSFARIRTEYVKDPDYLFVILSIKHKVYSKRDNASNMAFGVMEIVDFNAYDLKFLGKNDISYNPALGSGQLQVSLRATPAANQLFGNFRERTDRFNFFTTEDTEGNTEGKNKIFIILLCVLRGLYSVFSVVIIKTGRLNEVRDKRHTLHVKRNKNNMGVL